MFKKILIANRGEIASRILRTAHKFGIKTVCVYSTVDKESQPIRMANEAYCIGDPNPADSYLNIKKIIDIAKQSGSEAIHPGYGFLSENPAFAAACQEAGICFIGPSAKAMALMGSKQTAKAALKGSAVPVIPGYHGTDTQTKTLQKAAQEIGFPLLIKAAAGGGGKGMRRVDQAADFLAALAACQREALNSFGSDLVILEKYLSPTRHIEVQVFGDNFGNYAHLYERDCSLQRRHQKIVEEAPGVNLSEDLRNKIGQSAVEVARHIGYTNAGTVEFLLDAENNYYFMEMNTRLQVEHVVTEMITNIDMVAWQLLIAANHPLPLQQADIKHQGHAIEVRVYAEDPENDFLPSTGTLTYCVKPDDTEQHLRIESSLQAGDKIGIYYDPLLTKIIAWGSTRTQALLKLKKGLDHFHLVGIKTNLDFLRSLVDAIAFSETSIYTDFLEKNPELIDRLKTKRPNTFTWAIAAIGGLLNNIKTQQNGHYYHDEPGSPWQRKDAWRLNYTNTHQIQLKHRDALATVTIKQQEDEFIVHVQEPNAPESQPVMVSAAFAAPSILQVIIEGRSEFFYFLKNHNDIYLYANHQSFVFQIIHPFDAVLKLEGHGAEELLSPMPGIIRQIYVKVGDKVTAGTALLTLEAMKMEHTIKATHAGIVKKIHYNVGDTVDAQVDLIEIAENT